MTDPDDDTLTLRTDVLCILVECTRDRGLTALRQAASREAINDLADAIARGLGPRIGGRYVPKGSFRSGWVERAARDAAVWAAFDGRNHLELIRRFKVSRRLLYSILARRPRAPAQG